MTTEEWKTLLETPYGGREYIVLNELERRKFHLKEEEILSLVEYAEGTKTEADFEMVLLVTRSCKVDYSVARDKYYKWVDDEINRLEVEEMELNEIICQYEDYIGFDYEDGYYHRICEKYDKVVARLRELKFKKFNHEMEDVVNYEW